MTLAQGQVGAASSGGPPAPAATVSTVPGAPPGGPPTGAQPAVVVRGGGFAGLLRSSALFALGNVTGKLVGLFLLPIVTRALAPEAFGRLDVLSTLGTTVTSVAVLGLDVAATRLYPDVSPEQQRRLFGSWMAIAAIVLAPVLLVSIVGAPFFSRLLFGTSGEALGVVMVAVYAAGNLYQVIGLTALRNQARASTYALVSTAAFLVNGVAVVVLLKLHPAPGSAMTGMALGVAAGGCAAIVMARALVLHRPSRPMSRALLALGLPLVPALAATWIGDFVNRAILLHAAGSAQVGFLSVAVRFGSAGILVVTGFQLAWLPRAFAQGRTPEALARIARDAERIVVAVALALVPFAVCAPEILRLVAGSRYDAALPSIGFATVTSVGLAVFTIASMPSAIDRDMQVLGFAGTAGALSAIAANVVFAPRWGAVGTSAALALGQFVGLLVVTVRGRRAVHLPINTIAVARVALATVAVALVCTLPHDPAVQLRILAGAAFAGVLVVDGSARALVRFARNGLARR
jgi:O-antigen/teichoic acid export membrane protein